MRNLRDKLANFMIGRNGSDELSQAVVVEGIVFYFIYIFTRAGVFNVISTAALVYALFRVFSKNVSARAQENREFQKYIQFAKMKWELRKTHKVFLCKNCGKIVRVPKGKGKIEVTCPACRTTRIIKS